MKRSLLLLAVLSAAGICLASSVTGQVFAPDDLLDDLADAGFSVTAEEGPYRKVTSTGDGGFSSLPDGVVLMDSTTPFACACSTGSSCTVANPDGGSRLTAPQGQTLQPGWSGAGCVTKACVEMFGQESSWPDACPCPTLLSDGGGSGC